MAEPDRHLPPERRRERAPAANSRSTRSTRTDRDRTKPAAYNAPLQGRLLGHRGVSRRPAAPIARALMAGADRPASPTRSSANSCELHRRTTASPRAWAAIYYVLTPPGVDGVPRRQRATTARTTLLAKKNSKKDRKSPATNAASAATTRAINPTEPPHGRRQHDPLRRDPVDGGRPRATPSSASCQTRTGYDCQDGGFERRKQADEKRRKQRRSTKERRRIVRRSGRRRKSSRSKSRTVSKAAHIAGAQPGGKCPNPTATATPASPT